MSEEKKAGEKYLIDSKSKTSILVRLSLTVLSIAAIVVGLIIGLEIFEALGEFKRLGIIIIFSSIIGAVLLLASVKILNDLAYIKNKLDKGD